MRAIIDGEVYDTRKAEWLGENHGGDFDPDSGEPYPDGWQMTLYIQEGRYFLHCVGGGRTFFRMRRGNEWVAGDKIIPLPADKAESLAWREA
ncbi:MAG: hypothetical protein WBN64_09805 [Candidatus Deferrimicrobium sp.]